MNKRTAQHIADILAALESAEARSQSSYDPKAADYWRVVAEEEARCLEAIPEVDLTVKRG